jgi:hypothetical protein
MNEYLFRGKTKDLEWIEGYYIVTGGMPFIKRFGVMEPTLIIPGTSGQYIGWDTPSEEKIFAGDIFTKEGFWGFYIAFEQGAFRMVPLDRVQRLNHTHRIVMKEVTDTWEKVGNIHDNPEFLDSPKEEVEQETENSLIRKLKNKIQENYDTASRNYEKATVGTTDRFYFAGRIDVAVSLLKFLESIQNK